MCRIVSPSRTAPPRESREISAQLKTRRGKGGAEIVLLNPQRFIIVTWPLVIEERTIETYVDAREGKKKKRKEEYRQHEWNERLYRFVLEKLSKS